MADDMRRSTRRTGRAGISLESFEPRRLLAATGIATLTGDLLDIQGTRRSDTIVVLVDPQDATLLDVTVKSHLIKQVPFASVAFVTIIGGNGNDDITIQETLDVVGSIRGGNGDDTIRGGAGSDGILGDAGRDRLFGRGGGDVLEGMSGTDRLYGGAETDDLIGGRGDDYMDGGDEYDSIDGGPGDDTLFGGAGLDILVGGDGEDDLDGGPDGAYIRGGNGSDYTHGLSPQADRGPGDTDDSDVAARPDAVWE